MLTIANCTSFHQYSSSKCGHKFPVGLNHALHDLSQQQICGHTYYWNIGGMMYTTKRVTARDEFATNCTGITSSSL